MEQRRPFVQQVQLEITDLELPVIIGTVAVRARLLLNLGPALSEHQFRVFVLLALFPGDKGICDDDQDGDGYHQRQDQQGRGVSEGRFACAFIGGDHCEESCRT